MFVKPCPSTCIRVPPDAGPSWCEMVFQTCGVQGSGCRVQGSGFGVWGLGFRVQGSWFRVQGSGCRVQGVGCRVQTGRKEMATAPEAWLTCEAARM